MLCQGKNRVIAEYALRGIDKPIGIADYDLVRALPESLQSSLPSIEDIDAELGSEAGQTEWAALPSIQQKMGKLSRDSKWRPSGRR